MLILRDACAITDTSTDTTIITGGAFTQTMAVRYNLSVSIYVIFFYVTLLAGSIGNTAKYEPWQIPTWMRVLSIRQQSGKKQGSHI